MLDNGLYKHIIFLLLLSAASIIIPFSLASLDAIYFLILLIFAIQIGIFIHLCSKLLAKSKGERELKISFENPLTRKIKMISSAIEGSLVSRKMLSYTIKEIIETNLNVKLSQENSKNIIKEKDVIALVYPEENEEYIKDSKNYIKALTKFYKIVNKLGYE